MKTEIMVEKDVRELVMSTTIGRLACSDDDQPYIVPISYVYERNRLYGFSTFGQKIEWMRTNPNVCVEIDEIADRHHWASVVIFGRYEELHDLPQNRETRNHAREVLASRSMWWEPAFSFRKLKSSDPIYLFYTIKIVSMTGYRTVSELTQELDAVPLNKEA
jgi:uncharacterized protein